MFIAKLSLSIPQQPAPRDYGTTNRITLVPCWVSGPGHWNLNVSHYFTNTEIKNEVLRIAPTTTVAEIDKMNMAAFQKHYLQHGGQLKWFFQPSTIFAKIEKRITQTPKIRETLQIIDKTRMQRQILEMILRLTSKNRHNNTILDFSGEL